jgi:multiple sugar transport system ATP-binding protein
MIHTPHQQHLQIQNIKKSIGKNEILKGVSIDCAHGGFLVLVGPSGCGKSTLLNLIAGLDSPDSGQISLGGRDLVALEPSARDIAMVFQSYALYPTMTVRENLGFALEMRKVAPEVRKKKIAQVSELLKIDALLDRKPSQLSGGQRQRVAMGRALVRDPKLFLFDEPLSNLDAKLRGEMRTEIKRLHQTFGITSVYVTHDQIEAMTLGTQIAVMDQGRIVQFGAPDEVYRNPISPFVAEFLSSSPVRFVQAQITENGLGVGSSSWDLPPIAIERLKSRAGLSRSEVTLGLRSEAIELGDGRDLGHGIERSARVTLVQNLGSELVATVVIDGIETSLRLSARLRPSVGDQLRVVIDPGQLLFF